MTILEQKSCSYCDTFGGDKTYTNQVRMPLNGKVQCIDYCIHRIVAALNAGGVFTTSCCCGHHQQPGFIELYDGRWLTVTEGEPAWIKEVALHHAEVEQRIKRNTDS